MASTLLIYRVLPFAKFSVKIGQKIVIGKMLPKLEPILEMKHLWILERKSRQYMRFQNNKLWLNNKID